MTVHEVEFVPEVMSPVTSLDPDVIVPPEGEHETVGTAFVEEAVRCPAWSTTKRHVEFAHVALARAGVVEANTAKSGPVVDAVLMTSC